MNVDGKGVVPVGFSIPHKAPIFSGDFVRHDEQAPLLPHAFRVAHIGVAPANYY